MALIIPNEGEKRLLDLLTADRSNWSVRLFQNDVTPADTDTVATYTEATFSGYSAQSCPAFAASVTNAAGKAEATASSAVAFTHSGGATANTLYGYYVVRTGDSVLLFAERFSDGSRTLSSAGQEVRLTLTLTLTRES